MEQEKLFGSGTIQRVAGPRRGFFVVGSENMVSAQTLFIGHNLHPDYCGIYTPGGLGSAVCVNTTECHARMTKEAPFSRMEVGGCSSPLTIFK